MKKYMLVSIINVLLLLPFAQCLAQEPVAHPLLKIDCKDAAGLPRNFRIMAPAQAPGGQRVPSMTGLAELHASGSAQFSRQGLKAILLKVASPVTVIDLRQESHGFFDGDAVSWYGVNDWANRGLSQDMVEADEKERLTKALDGPLVIASGKNAATAAMTTITVHESLSEAQVVKAAGESYYRLSSPDHLRPTDDTVDRFIQITRSLPPDSWVHFHCAAGRGRTTTFLTMFDMLHNANTVTFADIIRRQALLGGEDLVFTPVDQVEEWKRDAYIERANFLRRFYEYAAANDKSLVWSEWSKNHPATIAAE